MVLRDLIPDFGMRVKSNVLCVRRGFGRLETFECSNLFSEWLQLPHIHRTIDHRTFPNFHPLALYRNKTLEPAYQPLHVDLDHQLKRRVLVPGPLPDQRCEPSDPENGGCNISSPPPTSNSNSSSAESASACYKNCRSSNLLNLRSPPVINFQSDPISIQIHNTIYESRRSAWL